MIDRLMEIDVHLSYANLNVFRASAGGEALGKLLTRSNCRSVRKLIEEPEE